MLPTTRVDEHPTHSETRGVPEPTSRIGEFQVLDLDDLAAKVREDGTSEGPVSHIGVVRASDCLFEQSYDEGNYIKKVINVCVCVCVFFFILTF